MRERLAALSFLAALALTPFVSTPATAQDEAPPQKSGVRITFLPPPMEGTLSLGVYDKRGKLVRVLAQEATEKDFTVGLNGLITLWDGRDGAGRVLPAGPYEVRGYSVGPLDVEGVALHANDWIGDDEAPRPVRVTGLRAMAADEVRVQLKTAAGTTFDSGILFGTTGEFSAKAGDKVEIAHDRVTSTVQGTTHKLTADDGEKIIAATLGAPDRVWLIVETSAGREVRACTLDGEFLRRLAYAPGDPQPSQILAARGDFAERWSEQIVLLEENAAVQRVRWLALPAQPPAAGDPAWATVLEKAIWQSPSFEAIKDHLDRPAEKPFVPEKEFVVRLINNPLLKDEPTAAHVTIGFNARGSFLQTTDGLPLRRVTETPRIQWAVIGHEGSGKLLTIFQGDGAVVEEFKVRRLANMMALDAGDYEWAGK